MKRLTFAALLGCMTLFAYAQNLKVSGRVVDASNGEPLVGATVSTSSGTRGGLTDAKGRFSFSIEQGNTLVISYVGFEKAEVDNPGANMLIQLTPSYELESIIVQGVRAKSTDPVSQTHISKKEIVREYVGQHPIFILDDLSPGIYSYSESGSAVGNYGQIRLRGIGQERINFTLNGVPLNDMIDHGVFFSNFSDISSSFESIQVQRGVGTSAAGVASYAGSINFESINLKQNPAFTQVELGAGSFDTYRTNVQVNTGVNEKGFGLYAAASKLWSDGYKDFTDTRATSFFVTGGYFGEKDMVRITAFSGRSENGLGYYAIEESILEEDPTYNNLTENDKDDFSQYMVQLQYSCELSSNLNWSNTLYYGGAGGDFAEGTPDVDSVFVENYFTQYNTTFFSINYPLRNDHYGVISNLYYDSEKWDISGGIHGYTFRRENREAILPDNANPYYDDQTQKDEFSAFAKVQYDLTAKASLFGDVQFRTMTLEFFPDYDFILQGLPPNVDIAFPETSFDFTFVNPKVGINYQFTPGINTFLSFGRSGREPTRIDLIGGFQLNANSFALLDDLQFEPEYVNDLEAGITINTQNLALEANVYYMDFENEIAPIGEVIAFGVQRRQNIQDSYRAGIEVAWNYLLLPKLGYRGNATYMRSEINSLNINGEAISDVSQILSPEWITTQGLNYEFLNGWSANVDINYMSESFMEYTNDPEFVVPSYATMDLGISGQITSNWNVSLLLNNVTDEQYYTFGTPVDNDFDGVQEPGFFVQPPRNFFITTRLRF
jgi:iron complex outermembrane receptor protein